MRSPQLVHLSFYRFLSLGTPSELQELKVNLKSFCLGLDLKGTVLLAAEGINVMLSGERASVDQFKDYARQAFGIAEDSFKEGAVSGHAFERLLVKVKKEIISVGDSEIRPYEKTGKRLSPSEFHQWISEKKPMVLLDTRNRYEIEVGTFEGAEDFRIDTSRQFAQKARENLERLKEAPVVTFCTGGIRCEKASAALMKLGLEEVYQLDGGILKYFEEKGASHFKGSCFVFDWRLSVDGELSPTARSDDADREFGRHRRFKKRV